jgi:hypothetical protein
MSLPDAHGRSSDGAGGEGGGEGGGRGGGDAVAQAPVNDYLADGELPPLKYSRATMERPPPPMFMFWGHAEGVDKSMLSQWFPSPFTYGGWCGIALPSLAVLL